MATELRKRTKQDGKKEEEERRKEEKRGELEKESKFEVTRRK